ncbi:MAG: hypothetical protein HOP10_14450 [Chitinophagaceae bacterium]|nr:hypothetical protein [Chitinophagaceae bacterium]
MHRYFAFIPFLLAVVSVSSAQSPGYINFTSYNRSNGLPEENIRSITQDSRGFIWIGSDEGLFRFDGLNFKSWYANPNDISKFTSNKTRVVDEYKPGILLFFSNYELWQINIATHNIIPLRSLQGRSILSIDKITTSKWCAISSDSLFITDNNLEIIYSCPLRQYFAANTTGCFPLNTSHILLYSSNPHKFFLFDLNDKKFIPLAISNKNTDSRAKFLVPQAYDSIRKRLYLSAYFNGNFYCDLDVPATKSYDPVQIVAQGDGAIRKSLLMPGGKLLQAGENGLYLVDLSDENLSQKKILTSVVLNIYQSRDGDLWLSTTNGIVRFNLFPPPVKTWNPGLHFKTDDEIKSVIKGNDKIIYFLAQDKSLNEFNTTTGNISRLDNRLIYCWSAVKNNEEIIATGSGKKILIYNTSTKKISYPAFLEPFYSNSTDVVTLVFKARNGDLWYSCNGSAGLIRNPAGTNEYIQYSTTQNPRPFSHSYVHCATEDVIGNIWFGSNRNGQLLKWNTHKQNFQEHPLPEILPGYQLKHGINNLYADASSNLWIALDGAGLVKYDLTKNTVIYYDINKGLPTDAVFGITGDSKKRIWLATRKGLSCYLPEQDNIVTFTVYDGFPEDNFESGGVFYDPENKLLYVGGKRTLCWFNPDELLNKTLKTLPPVFIDEMLVNGKAFYFENEKKISLKTKENNIEFNFAAPDLNRNNQLIFQYRLKGVSNEWIDLGDKRSVTFNNLQHGKYSLSVRTKYKGIETWNETNYPFSFSIKTPLQKTVWFRLLMITVAGVLVWFIIRSYYKQRLQRERSVLEKQQAIEKERTRIATDMHDDFGASLSRIKFLSEKLQLYKTGGETGSTDLQKISLYSDEMSEKMNEIVWALNQRYDSLEDLVSFCRSYASEYLQDKNIKLNYTTAGITERMIQGETRRNIFLVIKEALHNVVKHSAATEVSIFFTHDKTLEVVIADNGRGFTNEVIHPFANGLENMKKRMGDINGSILIENTNGTKLSISVPI